ncbi:MAG: hypothetical protein H8E14_01915 [Candidatus Marinimicrobia bacterium]|nr:hypothetical protein [Candidatus Neomarinimicrobiota bacterium]
MSDTLGSRTSGPATLPIVMSLVVKIVSSANQDVNNIYELIDIGRELHE